MFDYMYGTETGLWIALLLGKHRLVFTRRRNNFLTRKTVEQAVKEYEALIEKVFRDDTTYT
jgi:hypothetical protein